MRVCVSLSTERVDVLVLFSFEIIWFHFLFLLARKFDCHLMLPSSISLMYFLYFCFENYSLSFSSVFPSLLNISPIFFFFFHCYYNAQSAALQTTGLEKWWRWTYWGKSAMTFALFHYWIFSDGIVFDILRVPPLL